jgi:methionyl aminopeptidase
MAADALLMVGKHIRQGITTDEINTLVHEYAVSRGARPSPLNYRGFPKSVCTSPNEIVCHGIPSARIVKEGDILNVDITFCYPAQNGFHGDTSATFYIGQPSNPAKHVVEVARHCLDLGIAQVREGNRIGDIGAAIQEYAEANGCSVVRDFVGHGIGREFHSAPQVPHFGKFGTGKRLKAGMVFTVEPMINLGGYECEILGDGWTVSTRDRSLSAQFEHTVVVTKDGCEILTARSEVLKNSEDVAWLSTEQV